MGNCSITHFNIHSYGVPLKEKREETENRKKKKNIGPLTESSKENIGKIEILNIDIGLLNALDSWLWGSDSIFSVVCI